MPKLTLFDPPTDYSLSIVIVEDDKEDFLITKKSFETSRFSNELVWLSSGTSLVDYLKKQGDYAETGHRYPVLIFLDVNMPEASAHDIVTELRSQGLDQGLRLVLLTNVTEGTLAGSVLEGLPYIQKPLTFDKFYSYISKTKDFLFQ